ncbi:alpha/beta hydrolase [uncultured Pontibacter sp.]|uniref:alpha/beta hydrolase n=1 Tax=uncultured Pontibacter sp. TaxID=453356 RepID=UPI002612EBC2|nr:alpha/beta hydrolase [uncultured Pontibacter sp.]
MKKLISRLSFILAVIIQFGAGVLPIRHSDQTIRITVNVKNSTTEFIYLENVSGVLDKAGKVEFEIPLETARYVKLVVKETEILLFAEPRKDIHISFDERDIDNTIQFKGKNAAVNEFLYKQRDVGQRFNQYFNSHINTYLSKLPEKEFVAKMDSLQNGFLAPLDRLTKHYPNINKTFLREYRTDIELSFLAFLADYPLIHLKNTGKTISLSKDTKNRLEAINLNDHTLHKYDGLQGLLKNFLYQKIKKELTVRDYSYSDNKSLDAGFAVIKRSFTNQEVFDKVIHGFLLNHIENLGIKNIEDNMAYFNEHCQNQAYKEEINTLFKDASKKRESHLVTTYKEVNGLKLDAHIFMPDSVMEGKRHPVIAMFHGGSFYEGKPDWFFSSCESYAKKGWVAVAVEYRVADRHNNLLPEAISDGKSLVRYLRANAENLQIDTSKVMVAGNSAGATIALALATLDEKLDESSEDRSISSRPNAIMANAALADLTGSGHHWWHKHYDADFIEAISPLHQVGEDMPPMLLLHGTKDNSVDISSIRQFALRANEMGKQVSYHELKGAPHIIWLIPYFSKKVEKHRQEFIEKLNWE